MHHQPQAGTTPTSATGKRSITINRDAIGNVLVTGDQNNVSVTLLVADQRLLGQLLPPANESAQVGNPYRGLSAFYETDAALFFGREKLIRRAWTQFQQLQRGSGIRLLFVVGASGSGKSSFVRAGLLPEIAREPIEGLESPGVLVLRPGPAPISSLAGVLARVVRAEAAGELALKTPMKGGGVATLHEVLARRANASRSRFIIVVDQFEELYTDCEDSEARTAFVENLAFAASHPDRLVSVVVTLRSDFVGAVQAPASFVSAVRNNRLIVQAMEHGELYEAITRPAQEFGHPWPAPLVEGLLAQAEGRTGALPLLEFALKRLWPHHVSGRLEETHWSSHLIEDFLVQAADTLFETAGNSEENRASAQDIIRRAFLAMVQLGEGTEDTRRVAHLSEIAGDDDESQQVAHVLAAFTAPETRLITASEQSGEPAYELTHEALISSWARLRGWLGNVSDKAEGDRIRANLRLKRRLSAAAREWREGRGGVWRPPELEILLSVLTNIDLTRDEKTFVYRSRQEWHDHLERERRKEFRLRWFLRIAVVSAVVLGISALISAYLWNDANSQRAVVQREKLTVLSRFLALEAPRQQQALKDSERAALIARQSYLFASKLKSESTNLPYEGLWSVLTQPYFSNVFEGHEEEVTGIAINYDTGQLITADRKGNIEIRQLNNISNTPVHLSIPVLSYERPGELFALAGPAVSPTGLKVGYGDRDGIVRIWDIANPAAKPIELSGPTGRISSIAFSYRSNLIAVASPDNKIRIWSLDKPKLNPTDLIEYAVDHKAGSSDTWAPQDLAFSPDDHLLAFDGPDRTLHLYNLNTRRTTLIKVDSSGLSPAFAFSRDGKLIAAQAGLDAIKIWNVNKPLVQPVSLKSGCPGLDPYFLAFHYSHVACGGDMEGKLRVWNYKTPAAPPIELEGHRGSVTAVLFASETELISGSKDHTVRNWQLESPPAVVVSRPLPTRIWAEAAKYSADGQWIAIAGPSGGKFSALISPPAESAANSWRVLFESTDKIRAMSFGGNNRLLAIANGDRVNIYELSTPNVAPWILEPGPYKPRIIGGTTHTVENGNSVTSVVIDAQGSRIAAGYLDGRIRIWNLLDFQAPPLILETPDDWSGYPLALAFSHGGRFLVSGNWGGTVMVWDLVRSGELYATLSGHSLVQAVSFSPDDSHLITGDNGGIVALWNVRSLKQPEAILSTLSSVHDLAYSQDGSTIAIAADDTKLRIWDVREPSASPLILTTLPKNTNASKLLAVAFDSTGKAVSTVNDFGESSSFPTVGALADSVCKIVSRNLSLQAWTELMGDGIPYECTCPNLQPGQGATKCHF